MKVIIEMPEKEGREPDRVLEYFYQKCMEEPTLDKFRVEIEGKGLVKGRKM